MANARAAWVYWHLDADRLSLVEGQATVDRKGRFLANDYKPQGARMLTNADLPI